jgi:hypothetical protein
MSGILMQDGEPLKHAFDAGERTIAATDAFNSVLKRLADMPPLDLANERGSDLFKQTSEGTQQLFDLRQSFVVKRRVASILNMAETLRLVAQEGASLVSSGDVEGAIAAFSGAWQVATMIETEAISIGRRTGMEIPEALASGANVGENPFQVEPSSAGEIVNPHEAITGHSAAQDPPARPYVVSAAPDETAHPHDALTGPGVRQLSAVEAKLVDELAATYVQFGSDLRENDMGPGAPIWHLEKDERLRRLKLRVSELRAAMKKAQDRGAK